VFLFSGSGLSYIAGAECGWHLLAPAKSQANVQDIPNGIGVVMPVVWSPVLLCVPVLHKPLNTVHLHTLVFSGIFVDLGGEDRFALPMAMAELLARVCLMHHRHSSPVDQRKPLS